MKTLILYDSMGGNTEKLAQRIGRLVEAFGFESTILKLEKDTELDFYDYDLIFLGSPVIEWLPTRKMMDFLKRKLLDYRLNGNIPPSAVPIRPGKFVVCFGTNCGTHIGAEEALPMTEWMAAFFGHIGYRVLDKIHLPGEMRNFGQGRGWMDETVLEKINICGRYGDIRGRPNEDDLAEMGKRIQSILNSL